MFRRADLVLVTKTDLLPYVDFDVARHAADVKQLSPDARMIQVSATTGDGLADWYTWLRFSASAPG
jgi:hydrogenase nickel incorporation protein HypB